MTPGPFDSIVGQLAERRRLQAEVDAAYALVGILVDRAGGELRITEQELARVPLPPRTRLETYEDPRTLDRVIRRAR